MKSIGLLNSFYGYMSQWKNKTKTISRLYLKFLQPRSASQPALDLKYKHGHTIRKSSPQWYYSRKNYRVENNSKSQLLIIFPWNLNIFHKLAYIAYIPCFFGKSTVNLCKTSLVFPESVPKSAPLPSMTIKPNLLSSANSADRACNTIEKKINFKNERSKISLKVKVMGEKKNPTP